jgi:hypothetical protein
MAKSKKEKSGKKNEAPTWLGYATLNLQVLTSKRGRQDIKMPLVIFFFSRASLFLCVRYFWVFKIFPVPQKKRGPGF